MSERTHDTCQWKPLDATAKGIVVIPVSTRWEHCPRCCGRVDWTRGNGVCASGHFLGRVE
jgi:hypothetical protein